MRGEVNVGGGEGTNRSAPPLPEASFGERQKTRAAQTRVTKAALCLTAHCMILVAAAGVTEGGAGNSAARSVTVQDSLGDLGTSAALARCVPGL